MKALWKKRRPHRPNATLPPSAPPPHLPPEVIFEIIAQLHCYNRKQLAHTLASLALVSSAFRGPAQATLFHSIRIDICKAQRSRTKSLFMALLSNPSLNRLVQKLEIGVYASPKDAESIRFHMFPRSLRMHTLRLCAEELERRHRGGARWYKLPQALQRELCAMMQCSTTRILNLHDIRGIPTNVISTCAQLRELKVSGFTYFLPGPAADNAASQHATTRTELGYLEKLTLRHWYVTPIGTLVRALCDKTSSALSLQGLRTFSTDIHNDAQLEDCRTVLGISGHAIDELELNVYNRMSNCKLYWIAVEPPGKLVAITASLGSLENLHNVRSLELRPSSLEVFLSLFPILESFPSVHRFQKIVVHMKLWDWARTQRDVGVWEHVDELLLRERTLRRVSVVVAIHDEDMGNFIVEKVSLILGASGLLCVQAGYG
ncbi:hypothetical protein DXG03_006678 [Asterophora parasitica]|uniref:F-box domain-containing protein n=1 Tax=Asterophora parasitica TaxID=117018 RepID=A0A9P7K992_9AGAR|nr:hypothetical protein DXG03_006678 [Asterophora parasitica]